MTDTASALEALPSAVRAELNAFAGALDRLSLEQLRMHVAIPREPEHGQALVAVARVAREQELQDAVDAATGALDEALFRAYGDSKLRISSVFGVNMLQTSGPAEDTAGVVRSLEEAVTAIVLGDHLDVGDRAELLGLWDRLLP